MELRANIGRLCRPYRTFRRLEEFLNVFRFVRTFIIGFLPICRTSFCRNCIFSQESFTSLFPVVAGAGISGRNESRNLPGSISTSSFSPSVQRFTILSISSARASIPLPLASTLSGGSSVERKTDGRLLPSLPCGNACCPAGTCSVPQVPYRL